jgi:hypothetical protein
MVRADRSYHGTFTLKIKLAVQASSFKVHLYNLTTYYQNPQHVSTGSGHHQDARFQTYTATNVHTSV